jgi:hypothetical protein
VREVKKERPPRETAWLDMGDLADPSALPDGHPNFTDSSGYNAPKSEPPRPLKGFEVQWYENVR